MTSKLSLNVALLALVMLAVSCASDQPSEPKLPSAVNIVGDATPIANGIRAYRTKESDRALALEYVQFRFTDPVTRQVSLLTYVEALAQLRDEDMVEVVSTWDIIPKHRLEGGRGVKMSDRPSQPRATILSGGSGCPCWCCGTPPNCSPCSWGCLKTCYGDHPHDGE